MSSDELPAAGTPRRIATAPAARSGPGGRAGRVEPIDLLRLVPYGRLATSMRALPFLAVARHIVSDGHILLRMHRGFGHHEACDGSVVAYGADNYGSPGSGDGGNLWAVQFTGPAEIVHPRPEQEELFGAPPATVNGEPFTPAYLRVDPHFATEHTLDF